MILKRLFDEVVENFLLTFEVLQLRASNHEPGKNGSHDEQEADETKVRERDDAHHRLQTHKVTIRRTKNFWPEEEGK